MLSPVSSVERKNYNIGQSVQPVKKVPSNAEKAELESQIDKNSELKNNLAASNNVNPSVKPSNGQIQVEKTGSVSKTQNASSVQETQQKPEKARFDTYEKSEPVQSAGVYKKETDSEGNTKISFTAPEDVKDLYTKPKEDEQKQTPSNEQISNAMLYNVANNAQPQAVPTSNAEKESKAQFDDRSMLKIASDARADILHLDKSKMDNIQNNIDMSAVYESVTDVQKDDGMLYNIAENEKQNTTSNISLNVEKTSELDNRSLLKIADQSREQTLNVSAAAHTDAQSAVQSDYSQAQGDTAVSGEERRINMMKDELSNAAKQLNIQAQNDNEQKQKSVSETLFS